MEQTSKNPKRCPHYQLYSEPLEMDGPPSYLAVRRCLLTERLIAHLRQTEEGSLLAPKLLVRAAVDKEFAIVGPDFESVTQRTCSQTRCEERYTPAYQEHLDQFGVVDHREDEVVCEEDETETSSKSTKANCL